MPGLTREVDQSAEGLSIRLEPDPTRPNSWVVVYRNDGPHVFQSVSFGLAEGGIPTPGDLGSTIGQTRTLNRFEPGDELRIGSVSFVPGGEYLDIPLEASIFVGRQSLRNLTVNPEDFDRLDSLRAE